MRLQESLRRAVAAASLCVIWLAAGSGLLAAETVPSTRRLPPSVLFYASCPDFAQAQESFQKTSLGRMLLDPALEPFRQHLAERVNEEVASAEDRLDGIAPADLKSLLAGEVSLALIRVPGQPLGVVHFLEIGEHQDLLTKVLSQIAEQLGDKLEGQRTESVDGKTVTVWSLKPLPQDTSGKFREVAWFIEDGTFVAASGLPTLRAVTARWDGTHASTLESSPVFQEIMTRSQSSTDSQPATRWFVDPLGLITASLSVSPETQLMAVTFAGMAPSLGLNKLRGIGGVTEFATGEFDSVTRTNFYVDQPADGLLGIFELRPTISGPPAWVPAEAAHFFAIDWNARGAFEAVESKYDAMTGRPGNFRNMVNGLARRPGTGSIDPKEDIIDLLSGLIQSYSLPPQEDGQVRVWSLAVEDEDRAKSLLSTIQRLAGGSAGPELQGAPTFLLGGGSSPRAATVRDQSILLASSATALPATTGSALASPLSGSASFDAVQAHIPSQVSMLLYLAGPELFEASYNALRNGDYDGLVEGQIDFSLLPPFEALEKYFQPTVSYIVPHEKGGLQVWFNQKSEQP